MCKIRDQGVDLKKKNNLIKYIAHLNIPKADFPRPEQAFRLYMTLNISHLLYFS